MKKFLVVLATMSLVVGIASVSFADIIFSDLFYTRKIIKRNTVKSNTNHCGLSIHNSAHLGCELAERWKPFIFPPTFKSFCEERPSRRIGVVRRR